MLLFAILLSSLCVCVVSNNSPLFPKPLESYLIFVLDIKQFEITIFYLFSYHPFLVWLSTEVLICTVLKLKIPHQQHAQLSDCLVSSPWFGSFWG